jgi:hypothetical protein
LKIKFLRSPNGSGVILHEIFARRTSFFMATCSSWSAFLCPWIHYFFFESASPVSSLSALQSTGLSWVSSDSLSETEKSFAAITKMLAFRLLFPIAFKQFVALTKRSLLC